MEYKYDIISINKKGIEEFNQWTGIFTKKKKADEWYDRFGRHHVKQGHEIVRISKRKNGDWKVDREKITPKEFLDMRKK